MQNVTVTATVGDQGSIGHRHPAVTVAHGASRPWHMASAPEGPPDAVEGSQSEMPGLIAFFFVHSQRLAMGAVPFCAGGRRALNDAYRVRASAVRASF